MTMFRRALILVFIMVFGVSGSEALAGSVTSFNGVTVTTPDTYGACPTTTTYDTITSSGITGTPYYLVGWVSVQYVVGTSRVQVPGGYYTVNTSPGQDLNLTVSYPPVSQWQSGEIHVDLSLTLYDNGYAVYDASGNQVTFGPGQPWDVYCLNYPVPPPTSQGCTLTIGFWKTHAGFTGNNADQVTPLLPIWLGTPGGTDSVDVTTATQAVTLLKMNGDASNGINKLYAQLLAAKLDIANGASGAAVSSTISAADAFLAAHTATDWSTLSMTQQQQVLTWMNSLDEFNNGIIGPGHCSS